MARQRSDGARALREYLSMENQSVPKFCEMHGIDRIMVQRALNGDRQRISVDFAYAIERATGGKVPFHLWRQETRRDDVPASATTGTFRVCDCEKAKTGSEG